MALLFNFGVEDVTGNSLASGVYLRFDFYLPMKSTSMQFGLYTFRTESDYSNGKMPAALLYSTNTSPSKLAQLPSTLNVEISASPSVEESLTWT
jgi:hypothetical protein